MRRTFLDGTLWALLGVCASCAASGPGATGDPDASVARDPDAASDAGADTPDASPPPPFVPPQIGEVRAPAYPLFTSDPYFSVWSFSDKLCESWPRHWTG